MRQCRPCGWVLCIQNAFSSLANASKDSGLRGIQSWFESDTASSDADGPRFCFARRPTHEKEALLDGELALDVKGMPSGLLTLRIASGSEVEIVLIF